jgi:hypothetical protein
VENKINNLNALRLIDDQSPDLAFSNLGQLGGND